MFASDLMTRHVVTVSMDDSLAKVRELFERFKFHHLVVEEQGRVVGVISDRDLLKNISPFLGKFDERTQDANSLKKKVHQTMTRALIVATPDMPIQEVGLLMTQNRISCVPIVNKQMKIEGIITARDILKWCLQSGCTIVKPSENTEAA